ncbi:unnamed protein product, partial [Meganyctiphanes norvegica]
MCAQMLYNITNLLEVVSSYLLVVENFLEKACQCGFIKLTLKGPLAKLIKKTINADIPYVPWLTGYVAMLVGAVITFIMRSSSAFTSTLTPLIGVGLVCIERAYPLTLGANIGTTTTTILASLSGEGESMRDSIQIALVHLFFNIFGILIFYPIPFMRFPIALAKGLGNITSRYRWFPIAYLIFMFFLMPGFVFLLSLGGTIVLGCVLGPILGVLVIVVIINVIQNKKPKWLPRKLQDWDWLPLPLHSLEPYDKIITGWSCCRKCSGHEIEGDSA